MNGDNFLLPKIFVGFAEFGNSHQRMTSTSHKCREIIFGIGFFFLLVMATTIIRVEEIILEQEKNIDR